MTAAANELQKAIFQALGADASLVDLLGGPKIYDRTPANAPFPYITFGRSSAYDWSTGTEEGAEHLLTLHVWSRAKGRKQASDIIEAAGSCLHDRLLTLDGHVLVNCRLESSEVRHDDGQDVCRGVLRFRAVTEPAT